MRIICKCLGGSKMYGLDGPSSDEDIRGVFLNDTIHDIIGLGRHDHQQKQEGQKDEVYTEFRHTLNMLRQGNTQILELVFNDEWIQLEEEWKIVQNNKFSLIDPEKLFKCLLGYMQGELKLALGERKGKIGGKRYEQVIKHGFSPKNVVQLFRLAWCGQMFFTHGIFPTNIKKHDLSLDLLLRQIKFNPEKFKKQWLIENVDIQEKLLRVAYEKTTVKCKYDINLADNLCLQVYKKFLV